MVAPYGKLSAPWISNQPISFDDVCWQSLTIKQFIALQSYCSHFYLSLIMEMEMEMNKAFFLLIVILTFDHVRVCFSPVGAVNSLVGRMVTSSQPWFLLLFSCLSTI